MKALVLSGGGIHGAYQAGVIKHLMKDLGKTYDLYAGVSVGAINALGLAQFKTGQEKDAATYLEEMWLSIDNSSVWKHRFPPYLAGLWKSSFYSTKPLYKLLKHSLDNDKIKASNKMLRVAGVSLNTGEWRVWNEKSPDILDGVMASAAFPGFFETPKIDGNYWVDGGVRTVTPLKDAIDAGATDVDVILTVYPKIPQVNGKLKSYEVLLRSLSIMMDEIVENDLKVCMLKNNVDGYRKINLKIYRPSMQLEGSSLNFDPKLIKKEISLGYADAWSNQE